MQRDGTIDEKCQFDLPGLQPEAALIRMLPTPHVDHDELMKLLEFAKLSPQAYGAINVIVGFHDGKLDLVARRNGSDAWTVYWKDQFKMMKEGVESDTRLSLLEDVLAYFLDHKLKPFCAEPQSDLEKKFLSYGRVEHEEQDSQTAQNEVNLIGEYTVARTGKSRRIHITDLSVKRLTFLTDDPYDLKTGDLLKVDIVLDDDEESVINRKVKIKEIKEKHVVSEFCS